uniref:ABC transporter D family member 1-like isoform X2 n=1 Tax=Erigeron canadensis TaxID=72917 RepID=UPI001CB8DB05|nr:ABC transporter D family member 1-like isoform X2 [Erigeron canadensis]
MHMESDDGIFISEVDIITSSQKWKLTSPNGSGKSLVFMALRGLWPIISGRNGKPSHNANDVGEFSCGILYIPRKPYKIKISIISHMTKQKRRVSYGWGKDSDINIYSSEFRLLRPFSVEFNGLLSLLYFRLN